MKKTMLFTAAMAAVVSFSACKKDDAPSNNNATSSNMTATIDGNSWEATQSGASIASGFINISGKAADGKLISMTISTTEAGTFSLTGEHAGVYTPSEQSQSSYITNAGNGASGTCTITSIDKDKKTISGTFTMKALNPLDQTFAEITNGKFTNIPYTGEIPTTVNSSFSVKIDGQSWTPKAINAIDMMNIMNIIASDGSSGKSVSIMFPSTTGTGTFPLEAFGSYSAQYNVDLNTYMSVETGSVTISKYDKTNKIIEGTFNFDAKEAGGTATAKLTGGSFSVGYK